MKQIQISAKALGEINMEDFCERCFYIKLKTKKLPFQIFAGVLSSLDSYEKKVMKNWLSQRQNGKECPDFLNKLNVTGSIKPPHWSKFNCEIPEYGIKLTGMCDFIFTLGNGDLHISDGKTAKWTANQEKIFGLYQTQLNGYAYIASKDASLPPVESLSLIYFEPQNNEDSALGGAQPGFFKMQFNPKFIPVEVDIKSLDPLLARTREIFDGPIPESRNGCKDCEALAGIIELVKGK